MQRRKLIGPTIISLMLCALVADYLFLNQAPWSASRFLAKALAVMGVIFAPVVDPDFYGRFGNIFLPLAGLAVVIVFVWLILGRAKNAMTQATPDAEAAPAMGSVKSVRDAPAAEVSLPVPAAKRRLGLPAKLMFSMGAVGVLLGVASCVIVYTHLSRAVEKEVALRVDMTASTLRDIAAPGVKADQYELLGSAVERYASQDNIAYAYVENHEGRIVAHWPNDLPRHLRRNFPLSAERALAGVAGDYRGSQIYEVAKRISAGEPGFVHVAAWRQPVESETRRVVAMIGAAVVLTFLCVLGVFRWMMRQLSRTFADLVSQAERISKGDLAVPLALQRTDELGDIARSIERMRSSLRAVTARLEQGPPVRRSND